MGLSVQIQPIKENNVVVSGNFKDITGKSITFDLPENDRSVFINSSIKNVKPPIEIEPDVLFEKYNKYLDTIEVWGKASAETSGVLKVLATVKGEAGVKFVFKRGETQ